MRSRHDHRSPSAAPLAAGKARPANRAERRAAARGRAVVDGAASGPPVPGTSGPAALTKPQHARTDFAARRSG